MQRNAPPSIFCRFWDYPQNTIVGMICKGGFLGLYLPILIPINMGLRRILVTCAGIVAASMAVIAQQQIKISTPTTELTLSTFIDNELRQSHYGTKVIVEEGRSVIYPERGNGNSVYPSYGMSCPDVAAIAATHADGDMTLDFEVTGVATETGDDATITTIGLKDRVYPFYVDVRYKTWSDCDVIETWTEIHHDEDGPVLLRRYASGHLLIEGSDVWISHLSGHWAGEAQLVEEPLTAGTKEIKNSDGVRNSQTSHAEVMISLDGRPRENTGRVIGAALCYSGNYALRFDSRDEYTYLHRYDDGTFSALAANDSGHSFIAGINEENSQYTLKSGEIFVTPTLAITYSKEGLGGVSRNFHTWARTHKIANSNRLRKVLLNSWEGVYFDVNETKMFAMMDTFAELGGELFVMDDGWFGNGEYRRVDDKATLGDWETDTLKLPNGIDGLIKHAHRCGLKFGIWIEPEMTNTSSRLYQEHPEWVIKPMKRGVVTGRGRTQVVLDMSNPAVQDFVFGVVDSLMTSYSGIDYIKWDANMPIRCQGSQYLAPDEQSHLYIEYHRGLMGVLQRIRAKYPDLTMQACASGGGRANYGLLPYFDEFWVSDNTDALQRIYMQWGTSYFFPAIAMGSHVSASPNHQTNRELPLKFRTDVAMSGRMGVELDPTTFDESESKVISRAIESYKIIRPVVQQGDLYRLISPYYGNGIASIEYVSSDKERAVLFRWRFKRIEGDSQPIILAGLDPDKQYTVTELNGLKEGLLPFDGQTFTGAYLMSEGLQIPDEYPGYENGDNYSSRVLLLSTVVSDNQVEYEGRIYKLSPFVGTFMPEEKRNVSGAYQGAKYFSYKGRVLDDIRKEREAQSRNTGADNLDEDIEEAE